MESCPDKRMLESLLESDATAEQLHGHLEACADCRHTLEMLAGDPATWDGQRVWRIRCEANRRFKLMERLKHAEPLTEHEITAMLDTPTGPA